MMQPNYGPQPRMMPPKHQNPMYQQHQQAIPRMAPPNNSQPGGPPDKFNFQSNGPMARNDEQQRL